MEEKNKAYSNQGKIFSQSTCTVDSVSKKC